MSRVFYVWRKVDIILCMKTKKTDLSNYDPAIFKGASNPLRFLKKVMEGKDPRRKNPVVKKIREIYEYNFGAPPDQDQWDELVKMIEKYEADIPDLRASQSAASDLANYLHARRKQIDVKSKSVIAVQDIRLTKDEINDFWKKFNGNF